MEADYMRSFRDKSQHLRLVETLKPSEELFTDHLYFSESGQKVQENRKRMLGERNRRKNLDREIAQIRKLNSHITESARRVCDNVALENGEKEVFETQAFWAPLNVAKPVALDKRALAEKERREKKKKEEDDKVKGLEQAREFARGMFSSQVEKIHSVTMEAENFALQALQAEHAAEQAEAVNNDK